MADCTQVQASPRIERMQYTIRNIPPAVDGALRRRARSRAQSLNTVILDALATGSGLSGTRPARRNLEGIAGSGALDAPVLAAIRSQHKVDRKLWR